MDEAAIPSTRSHEDTLLPDAMAEQDWEQHSDSPTEQPDTIMLEALKPPIREAETEQVVRGDLDKELEQWRDRALRLQADMENYRKRQQRNAQDQVGQERNRLLNAFLDIVDDLERALAAPVSGDDMPPDDGLRRGVELTHRAAIQLLEREGAVPIEAEQKPFDPNWHQAVGTIQRNGTEVAPGTVIEVIEPGYRLDDQLLRPAKVVVAV